MTTPPEQGARLTRNTFLYSLNAVLARTASIIMLPVYTRYLTPADYGVLALLQVVVEVAAIALTAGLSGGVMRFYFKARTDSERSSVLSSAYAFEVGAATAGAIIIWIAAPAIASVVLSDEAPASMVRLAGVNFILGAMGGTPSTYLTMRERAGALTTISLIKLGIQLSLNIVFVVGMQMGPWGIMWSTFVASVVINGFLGVMMLRESGLTMQLRVVRDLRRFTVPYQVTTAGNFLLTFGERFFLGPMSGAAAVGIYGLAYQFGFLLYQVGLNPFLQAWVPNMFRLASLPREERDSQYSQGFFSANLLFLSCATAICLFVKPMLRILTTPEYFPAADIVPVVVLAYVVAGWTVIVKFGIDVSEETRFYTYATWAAVGATLVFFILLIPTWGGLGAAWATVAGFTVRLALTVFWAQRLWPVAYGWPRSLRLFALAGGIGVTPWIVPLDELPLQVSFATVGFSVYCCVTWFLLHSDERAIVAQVIRNPRGLVTILRGRPGPSEASIRSVVGVTPQA